MEAALSNPIGPYPARLERELDRYWQHDSDLDAPRRATGESC